MIKPHSIPVNPVILSEASRNASPREAQSKDPDAARTTKTVRTFLPTTPLLAPFAIILLALTTTKLHAQAAPTATGPGSFLSIGIAASGFQQDYGRHHIGGEAAYLDANLYRRIGVEVEVRRLNVHTEEDVKENTYLAGLKIATNPRRFRPYLKLLMGRGTIDFPFHYATGSYFVIAPSTGLDYHLRNSRFNIRVVDFQYQLWPQFSFGTLHPYGITTGISFDLLRPGFNPHGNRIHLN